MISFAHFENFDTQPNEFKNGSEKEKSEFDSFMLAFSFAPTANDIEKPKLEIGSNIDDISVKPFEDADFNSADTTMKNGDLETTDRTVLADGEADISSFQSSDWRNFQNSSNSDKQAILRTDVFADLQNSGNSEDTSSAEFSADPSLLRYENESPNADIDSGKTQFEIAPDSKNNDFNPNIAPESKNSEFIPNLKLDSNESDPDPILDFRVKEKSVPEIMKEVENPEFNLSKDPAINIKNKVTSEAEIDKIMEMEFLASETETVNSQTEEENSNSAEKIDLWRFKSPDFHDQKDKVEIFSENKDYTKSAPIQESNFEISEVSITENSVNEEILFVDLKNPNAETFNAKDQTDDTNILELHQQQVKEPNVNFVDVEIPQTSEVEIISNEQKIQSNSAELYENNDRKIPAGIDLGEKRITNLNNHQPIEVPTNKPRIGLDASVDSVQNNQKPIDVPTNEPRLDLGERAIGNLSNKMPTPIHRQDLGERSAGNLSKKFPKLINEISEYFEKLKPEAMITENKPLEAKIVENTLNVASETYQLKTPVKIKSNEATAVEIDVNLFKNQKTDQPENLFRSDENTDNKFEIIPPIKNPKSQIEPPKVLNPEKKADIFRVDNAQTEIGNWTEVSIKDQNAVEEINFSEQIELPVLDQIETPLIEYMNLGEGIEKSEILKLRLRPAELGTVEIRLEKDSSGNLEVHFQAENEQAKHILAENFGKLREALQNNGWQVERLEISNSLLSSNGFEKGGENPSNSETNGNSFHTKENTDGFSDQSDDLNQNDPNRLVNLRA